MNDKTRIKQEKLIEMTSSFCDEHLNEEYKQLSVKLIEKLGRKHNVPFKRGKLENWASGIVYAIAQINFLFDKSQELHTSPDEICNYFATKKSTASNKARDIREMFNMGHFDKEFSSNDILNDAPTFYMDDKGFIIPSEMVDDNPMDEFFDNAFELFEEGRTEEALVMLNSIPEDSPEYGRALFYKSVMLSNQGDEEGAFKLFEEALANELSNRSHEEPIDFGDVGELWDYAKICYNMGDYDEAIDYFDLVLDEKQDCDEALYYKSVSLANIGDFNQALKTVNEAIKLNPNDDRYWNDKANFLVKLNREKEAHECFDHAIELNPDDSILWANKAFAYLESDETDKALQCYDKAIEIAPEDVHPVIGKANAYMMMGDFDNAEKHFVLARQIDENDEEYLTNYAQFMLIQQKFTEAIELWDKCIEIDDENPMYWIYKAMAYAGLDDDEMFELSLERASELNPLSILALDDLLEDMDN